MLETEHGILCSGDIELDQNRTLVVTATNDLRMQALLALLHEVLGDLLGESRITYDKIPVIDKRTGKMRIQPPGKVRDRRRPKKK